MGFLQDIGNKIGEIAKGNIGDTTTSAAFIKDLYPSGQTRLWSISGQDWYKVYGYQFQVRVKDNSKASFVPKFYFTLPIPPQVWDASPVLPSRITPTLGGITEEVSKVSLWDISMSGTTGIAASRQEGDEEKRQFVAKRFRDTITTTGLLAGQFAKVNKAINKIGGLVDSAINTVQGVANAKNPLDALSQGVGGVTGAINNALLPALPYSSSAVSDVTNGYTEAQELEKFFFIYHHIKAENPEKYALYFVNYKTNQEWRVAIKGFRLRKAANQPFLYQYSIVLKGWDCTEANSTERDDQEYDRFNGDLKSVNTMGLMGNKTVQSAINGFKDRFKVKF